MAEAQSHGAPVSGAVGAGGGRQYPADITEATTVEWADAIRAACRLGSVDATGGTPATTPARSGHAVLRALGITSFRVGHKRALKRAYSAGRFHVDTMGAP